MSKTLSKPINKENASAIGVAVIVCGVALYALASIVPGLIDIISPIKSGVSADPIDKVTVNAAIQYIQTQ